MTKNTRPVFDTDALQNMSYGELEDLSLLQLQLGHLDDLPYEAAVQVLPNLRKFLAKVTVSVPDNWLVSDAPKPLDFDDAEAFRWLRAGAMQRLMSQFQEVQATENMSGN